MIMYLNFHGIATATAAHASDSPYFALAQNTGPAKLCGTRCLVLLTVWPSF